METFVVRVWRANHDSGSAEDRGVPLRGFVENVREGSSIRFGGGEELLRFLRGSMAHGFGTVGNVASPGEGDPGCLHVRARWDPRSSRP